MKTVSVINGPYIHSIGWISSPSFEVNVSDLINDNSAISKPPFEFDKAGNTHRCEPLEPKIIDIPFPIRKKSNVARSRSAAKATIFASLLAGGLLKNNLVSNQETGVACVSSSSTLPIAWEFESTGVKDGWKNTDTMLLPSSIPSAISTQTAAAYDLHATAVTFLDGLFGTCAALEYTALCFHYQRAQALLILCAEEVCPPQLIAIEHLNNPELNLFNGASGIYLSKTKKKTGSWQLKIIQRIKDSESVQLPSEWNSSSKCHHYTFSLTNKLTAFTSFLLPLLMNQLFTEFKKDKVLIRTEQDKNGYLLGFEWVE